MWSLREEEALNYERRLTGKFQEQSKKRKDLSDPERLALTGSAAGGDKRPKRRYTRRSGKRADVVRLLAALSARHKEAADAATFAEGGVLPPELQLLFANPFKGWGDADSELKIRRKLGDDKYLFLMQVFHYFEDLLLRALDDTAPMPQTVRHHFV